jgi:hypothetical protein
MLQDIKKAVCECFASEQERVPCQGGCAETNHL